jgi:hypothetical protein
VGEVVDERGQRMVRGRSLAHAGGAAHETTLLV